MLSQAKTTQLFTQQYSPKKTHSVNPYQLHKAAAISNIRIYRKFSIDSTQSTRSFSITINSKMQLNRATNDHIPLRGVQKQGYGYYPLLSDGKSSESRVRMTSIENPLQTIFRIRQKTLRVKCV